MYKIVRVGKPTYSLTTYYEKPKLIEGLLNRFGWVYKHNYTLESYKRVTGPAHYAINNAKRLLKKLETLGTVKLWLTSADKSNFRYKVAKTKGPNGHGYKAGRPPKPIYYDEVREWLFKQRLYEVEEVFGIEADDALGINQTENTVAVHQDKDINRIIGKHLNWKTMERYVVKDSLGHIELDEKRKLRGCGNSFFFAQMLMGDRTDNIPGINKMGDVGAYKQLINCSNEQDMLNVVLEYYKKQYGDSCLDVVYEIADLLYILDSSKTRGSEYLCQMMK